MGFKMRKQKKTGGNSLRYLLMAKRAYFLFGEKNEEKSRAVATGGSKDIDIVWTPISVV